MNKANLYAPVANRCAISTDSLCEKEIHTNSFGLSILDVTNLFLHAAALLSKYHAHNQDTLTEQSFISNF